MMRRYLLGYILILFYLDLHAQEPIAKTLDGARILAKQGRYGQLIEMLTPLLNSPALDTAERSKALILVAAGYQASGNFSASHRALDQSLSLLRDHPQCTSDYADALTNLSVLYRDAGDADAMDRTALKALQLYEQADDHTGLVGVYVVLAQDSVNRRKPADSERYLAEAERESRQLDKLGDGNRIAMADLQAAIALLEGHPILAVADYRQSLDLRIQLNGVQHPDTGWGYMLLGKADLQSGDIKSALANMRQGLATLAQTDGPGHVAYLYSEVAYSEALAADGQRSQAKHVKAEATQALAKLYRDQCAKCQINVAALR
jgi:tetratricopeptide (TPR) repeat protein